MAYSKFKNRKSTFDQNGNEIDVVELNGTQNQFGLPQMKNKLTLKISAYTWYRDSHGLFDYEEDKKMTIDHLEFQNENFVLKRDNDRISYEKFDDFEQMRNNQ